MRSAGIFAEASGLASVEPAWAAENAQNAVNATQSAAAATLMGTDFFNSVLLLESTPGLAPARTFYINSRNNCRDACLAGAGAASQSTIPLKRKHFHCARKTRRLARNLLVRNVAAAVSRPMLRHPKRRACLLNFRQFVVVETQSKRALFGARSGSPTPPLEEVEMKNRTLFALLLAGLLAIPAFAQDSSTTTSQPAAQAPTKADAATGKDPLQPQTHEGFWGSLNPFARKKYVQRQTQPIRDRVNELDELTSANTKEIKDVDSRAQAGIQMASTKANEADQHAVDAGNKATAAQQTATQANNRLTTVEGVVSNIDQYKATNQTEIRFRPGQSILSTDAKT